MSDIEEMIRFLKDIKLLYVEDNNEARESTLEVLEEFFSNITVAIDGMDGLDKFKNNDIELIITDINMPKLNGLKMIEEIKKIDKEVSVLILSAYGESEYFMESIKLGVDGYLLKPIEMSQFITILKKVTEKIKLKNELEYNLNLFKQYQEITDKSNIVSKTDPNGKITYVNDKFCTISEYSKEELIGKNHNIIRHPDVSKEFFSDMWHTIKDKKEIWQGIVKNRTKSGGFYYVKSTIKPILDKDGKIIEYISLRSDITDIMDQKKQLNEFCESVDELMVAYVKIDDFYDIERFYGRKIAHKLENTFGDKLFEYAPEDCKFKRIYSLGNGEFVFAKNINNCPIGAENIIKQFKEFQQRVNSDKIQIEEIAYDITILISLSFGKNAIDDAKYGLQELYRTKQSFILSDNFTKIEHDKAEENLKIIRLIKKAIKDGRIVSFFQPIVNNKTKEVEKYESLVRLIDENKNILPPHFFLDIAKRGRYYSQITSIVIKNTFDVLKKIDKDISINLSVIDIEKYSTREKIFHLLKENREYANRIVFELLEDESIKDFNLLKEFVATVKKMGVKIAIDDFGSGYSNFERLLDYQPDIIKIDGSLIKNITDSAWSLSIVKTIITFAKEQNIKIVAEFVENENIYNILRDLGIDYSQGYFFSKPIELSK